jgi:C4-dicarboxylate-specific signal transduction histidine kinase
MASLGQMLANIAHQWRQPLTELNLTLFNMKKASIQNNEKKVDELYKESKTLISSMSSTIDDFTNFFNPQKEKKSFEIKDAINEALIILRKVIELENIHIQIDVPINYKVIGVSNELSQVIINLIQNSKDAFIQNDIKNKTIIITLKEELILDKKYALLEIKDNAGGISKENIDKIFDPYFTTKYKSQGTGLGLFMSKMIIEKSLEGELSHKNCDDGSIFIIKLILG